MVTAAHPWKLVAPWYRWPRAGVPQDGRASAPAIQKFAGSSFVQDFMARPQHSLVYDPAVDVVSNVDLVAARSGANLPDKLAALFATLDDGTPVKPSAASDLNVLKNLRRARLVPTSLRKLFLPLHDRFYLVVCELHCDLPGFPSADRKQVCQAGFAVRRRRRVMPAALVEQAGVKAQQVRQLEAEYAELREFSPLGARLGAVRSSQVAALEASGGLAPALDQLRQVIATANADLQAWFTANGVTVDIEGWYPAMVGDKPSTTLGAWHTLGGADEHVYPLYPLVPDPREPDHDAAGRTLYYGIVPLASMQVEASGRARFDDVNTFEISCFVRRHHPCPARNGKTPDCHGELVWSAPTEPYRIAAPFDTLGCANRPITIKMPDLRELAAQVMARPRGRLSPVKFVQPQHLSPKIKDGQADGGDMAGNAICFFSIPLITIIALFVLNLFLPIVVFIFQLWFLLVLRFCIPPQIKFGAGLDAALAASPPGIDFDADFAVTVDGTALTALELKLGLEGSIKTRIGEDTGMDSGDIELGPFSNNALGPLGQSLDDNKNLPKDPNAQVPGVDYASGLVYEPHRTPQWHAAGGRG